MHTKLDRSSDLATGQSVRWSASGSGVARGLRAGGVEHNFVIGTPIQDDAVVRLWPWADI
jgi:hypothetical protein